MLTLKRGMNFGGWFSQCPINEDHYESFLSEKDVEWVAANGFDHIRLPVDYEYLSSEKHFKQLDDFFACCQKNKLNVILDLHKAPGYDFNQAGDGSDYLPLFKYRSVQEQFIEIWVELAKRYSKFDNVAFELLNEVVDERYIRPWNRLIRKTVKAIRSITKESTIIYGGALWNSALTVCKLQKPVSDNIIFTFHYYEPLLFTHQKAYWVKTMNPELTVEYPGDIDWYKTESAKLGLQGKPIQVYNGKEIGKDFHRQFIDGAIQAAKKRGVSLYCGEFGVIDRAPVKSTENWFNDVIQTFEENEIGYSVWNYKELDFGLTGPHYSDVQKSLVRR